MSGQIKAADHYIDFIDTQDNVSKWMTSRPITINVEQTLYDCIQLMQQYNFYGFPVIGNDGKLEGLVTKTVIIRSLASKVPFETPIKLLMETKVAVISPLAPLNSAVEMKDGCLPVINENRRLIGIITRTDILRANSLHLGQFVSTIDYMNTLREVLNTAYEGIVVVDNQGLILEINDAYCRFLGDKKENLYGKHVEDVIENTRLHIVIKTGEAERGRIQRIGGQDMIVHRIPIKKGNRIESAIGVLVFKDIGEMNEILERISNSSKVKQQLDATHKENYYLDKIIGHSPVIMKAKELARKASGIPSTVLITGPSGTGKELFAQAIHELSRYSKSNFVSVNCSAIPESLLESELFGYERGAFTGAKKSGKKGKFELAENGTLFLDEIGDMPLLMQSKILRVLQDKTLEPIGSTTKKRINVRIIAATNRNLEDMVKKGLFREDLYYRLNVIRMKLPSLREHMEDVPPLINYFIKKYCQEFGFPLKNLSENCWEMLKNYNWPGNTRELINLCERMVGLSEERLTLTDKDLPENIQYSTSISKKRTTPVIKEVSESTEKTLIIEILSECKGNKTAAASKLGIQRSTLYKKMFKYKIQ